MNTPYISKENITNWKGSILAYGHFSTIHPGHIRYLRHAQNQGDRLIVALIGDKEEKYPFPQKDRAEALSLLNIADGIILLEGNELKSVIDKVKPNIVVLGNEYKDKPEVELILKKQREAGRVVKFHAGEIRYDSADLLKGSENDLRQKRYEIFEAACQRQGIKKQQLLTAISEWGETRLIVLGDTIVDQYAACEAIGMSAEAPVVVVKELERKNFIGGAAIVAAHISALGAKCDLISVIGDDEAGREVEAKLISNDIGNGLCIDVTRPTTFKKRYVVGNQKLFRVSRLEENNLQKSIEDEIIRKLKLLAPRANGIVISDFVYGVVTNRVLEEAQKVARENKLMLFGDLQCSSQVGSIIKFKDFSLLCPNEREARLALQNKQDGLEQVSQQLLKVTNTERLIMKLGSEGFIAYDRTAGNDIISQAFPALSVNPVDVAGAGDSLLALMATGMASKQKMLPTAAIACFMTSLAVENMGNTPITVETLQKCLKDTMWS